MGGAAMADPRGTYGSAGASMSNAMRAGMGAYLPMMQWQQQRADKKDEKDYRKSRDRIMDRFRKDTQSFQAAQMELSQFNAESTRMNAESMSSIRDLQRQTLQRQIEKDKEMQKLMQQFMPSPNKVSEMRATDTGVGPLQSKVPQQFGPLAEQKPQQPGMIEMSNLSQYNPNPIGAMQQQANTAGASIPQSVAPPQQAPHVVSGHLRGLLWRCDRLRDRRGRGIRLLLHCAYRVGVVLGQIIHLDHPRLLRCLFSKGTELLRDLGLQWAHAGISGTHLGDFVRRWHELLHHLLHLLVLLDLSLQRLALEISYRAHRLRVHPCGLGVELRQLHLRGLE